MSGVSGNGALDVRAVSLDTVAMPIRIHIHPASKVICSEFDVQDRVGLRIIVQVNCGFWLNWVYLGVFNIHARLSNHILILPKNTLLFRCILPFIFSIPLTLPRRILPFNRRQLLNLRAPKPLFLHLNYPRDFFNQF